MNNAAHSQITATLERLALEQPTAPAMNAPGSRTLTYSSLGEHVRDVQAQLQRWDIVPGDLLAAVIVSRPALAMACLTVCGAATFSPLGPRLVADTYRSLLRRLAPKAIILECPATHPARAVVHELGIAAIELRVDPAGPAGSFTLHASRSRIASRAAPQVDPGWAFVLPTSGSTGAGKLVPISHRRSSRNASVLKARFALRPDDVGCHLTPLHMAQGLNQGLMLPLLAGSSIIVLDDADVSGFFLGLEAHRVTWTTAGFTLVRNLAARAPEFARTLGRSRLRFVRCASGTLEAESIQRFESRLDAPLIAAYSAVETGAISQDPLPPGIRKPGGAGVPVDSEVAIVGASGEPCARGESGEILVRGPMVFDRYFDGPELDAQAFLGDWYRTGDVGSFDEDGYLFVRGRTKDYINRGGEKILPAEVDAAMAVVPGVQEAAAFSVPHPTLGEELVAAVVRDRGSELQPLQVIRTVRERLGATRAPRRIYFLDSLPRTDSGKVRRSELKTLVDGGAFERARAAGGTDRQSTALESALQGLWAAVLGVSSVGLDDDFFLLGGDSLSGARLLAGVDAVFGTTLPIERLFAEAATVAGMALALQSARARPA